MNKKTIGLGTIAVLLIAGVLIMNSRPVERLEFAINLFSGEEQYENFNRMNEIFPVSTMSPSPEPFEFDEAAQHIELPRSFAFKGRSVDVQSFLGETDTAALLVLKDGEIVFENYTLTGGRDVNWLSMSVAKSFVSAAVGVAVDEGLIDIEDPVTDYTPSLKGSAYDGVRVKDILQMSSGARWNEDYSDPKSDVNQLGKIMGVGGDLNAFLETLEREHEPGTLNQYNSMDTQVLGYLLVTATGRSITDYMQEKLWHPLGMESEGHWLIDSKNMEMAFFGLNATARDYAKLGELFRNGGEWQGKQIISPQWVAASIVPDAPHLVPGANADFPMGYGYQWWLMDGDEGEYSAIGVYNQFIYVHPTKDIVIVKLSANSSYGMTDTEESYREFETVELFRAIVGEVSK